MGKMKRDWDRREERPGTDEKRDRDRREETESDSEKREETVRGRGRNRRVLTDRNEGRRG